MSTEQTTYREFHRSIINRFRKYDQQDLVHRIWVHVNKVPCPFDTDELNAASDEYKDMPWHPWSDLLLLKWILMDDHFLLPNRKTAPDEILYRLLHDMFNSSNVTGHLQDDSLLQLFMRATVYQQSTYQRTLDAGKVIRQFKFFSYLQPNHTLRKLFHDETGLDIEDVLFMNTLLCAQCISNQPLVPVNWSMFAQIGISEEKIQLYAKLMSGTMLELHDYLTKGNGFSKPGRNPNENFERTPFVLKPLFWRTNSKIFPIHKVAVMRCAENYVYDKLRQLDARTLMDRFGKPVFEKYVLELVESSKATYYDEDALQAIYDALGVKSSRIVDCLIREGDLNIFIDAKAVSTPLDGMVSSNAETVRRRTKNSALGAIEQANKTLAALRGAPEKKIISDPGSNHLLVVTYEDLMIGNGVAFAEILQSIERDIESAHIEADHIHFLDVGDFQLLCESVGRGDHTFQDLFAHIGEAGDCIHTRKLSFSSHLHNLGITQPVSSADEFVREITLCRDKATGQTAPTLAT